MVHIRFIKEKNNDLIEFKFDSLTFDEKKLFLKHLDFEIN